jgi:hypothetical protein
MLIVGNTIIPDDIFQKKFVCDITKCKGVCCIEGDAGAPLEEEEIGILEDSIDIIKQYMCNDGITIIEKNGVFDYDETGNLVTPLIHNQECAFVYYENNIAKCAIEQAYNDKKIKFQKPISCHLYPIRITPHLHYDSLTYHHWNICQDACKNGKKLNVSIFDFLEIPLTRKYGKAWIKKVKKLKEIF